MKILDKIEPYYKRWVNPKIQGDPVTDHLARIVLIAAIFLTPGLFILIWIYAEIGYDYGVYALQFYIPALLTFVLAFRYVQNFDLIYHHAMLSNVILTILLMMGDGGLNSTYSSLFVIILWLGFYYDFRKGLVWAIIVILVCFGLLACQLNGIWIVQVFPEEYRILFLSLVFIYFLIYCAVLFGASKFNELRLIRKLDKSQKLLIRNEKMASLGQLTAGIAHEINNPINFINGSAEALELDFQDLQSVLDKLILLEKSPNEKLKAELLLNIKAVNLEALRSEMKAMIQNLKNGSQRVTEIVKGMERYTYQSSNTFEMRQVEHILNDALIIMSNRLKEKQIEVVKNYNLNRKIPCLPGKLNQVFVNIIDNAVGAMLINGRLEITTSSNDKEVCIQFKDNGKGMEEKIQGKVFDPFFTTKPIGEGTGLGMAISYGIIKDHGGTINIESSLNNGTIISIYLPLEQID